MSKRRRNQVNRIISEAVNHPWTKEATCENPESRRIARQRKAWSSIPDGEGIRRLRAAMEDRARELVALGRLEEADAILEFLPAGDAERLLDDELGED